MVLNVKNILFDVEKSKEGQSVSLNLNIPQSQKSRRVHLSTCQRGKISCQSVESQSVEILISQFRFHCQVPRGVRPPGALRVPGVPQHPPVLRHQEGGEEEAEADGQQSQGGAGGASQEVNTNHILY